MSALTNFTTFYLDTQRLQLGLSNPFSDQDDSFVEELAELPENEKQSCEQLSAILDALKSERYIPNDHQPALDSRDRHLNLFDKKSCAYVPVVHEKIPSEKLKKMKSVAEQKLPSVAIFSDFVELRFAEPLSTDYRELLTRFLQKQFGLQPTNLVFQVEQETVQPSRDRPAR